MAAYLLAHDGPAGVTVAELAAAAGVTEAAAHQFLYRATRRGYAVKRPASWRPSPRLRRGPVQVETITPQGDPL